MPRSRSGAGRGYVSAENQATQDRPIGVIPIDSMFSPVTKVNFEVENTRIGQRIDYDKLTLEVWTDGSILPVGRARVRRQDPEGPLQPVRPLRGGDRGRGRGGGGRGVPAHQGAARAERRGAGALGALLELPEGREHQDDRRPGARSPRARCSSTGTSAASRSRRSRTSSPNMSLHFGMDVAKYKLGEKIERRRPRSDRAHRAAARARPAGP